MSISLNDIYEKLGSLNSNVEHLRREIEDSHKHRSIIRGHIEDLNAKVDKIDADMKSVKYDLADAKLITDEVRMWKQRGIGAIGMAGLAGTAIGVGLASYGERMIEWAQRFLK